MKDRLHKIPGLRYLGIEPYNVSHTERLISALGAFIGILAIVYCSRYFLDGISSYLIVASMGASSVLLFAVPHGRLSQPWPLLGGHMLSAFAGIVCARLIPDISLAGAAAVSSAVALMYYLHCIHPPGGATALTAAIGGEQVVELGFQYMLTPVLLNTLIILCIAICFNYPFRWRRYPAYLARKEQRAEKAIKNDDRFSAISHEDFVYALSEIDSLLDVSENDLLRIYDLVTTRHQSSTSYHSLELGRFYSNGAYGDDWSVRQIIDWNDDDDGDAQLIYKTIAGANRRQTGTISKKCFARWAKHEVTRDEENWRRVDNNSSHE